MINEGKKLPPDAHPEDMVRGVHYRLKVISVETLRDLRRNGVSLRFRNPLDFENSKKLRFFRKWLPKENATGKRPRKQE
ncbi:MAG: hypothetical protein J4469_01585 [Candidatus Aenigmarchaeota archaeon]|nr:hypothetical protein [Candidatus Aenigmarchaeota archaeon]